MRWDNKLDPAALVKSINVAMLRPAKSMPLKNSIINTQRREKPSSSGRSNCYSDSTRSTLCREQVRMLACSRPT